MFPYGFWDSPIWKEAARAGLRQISNMVNSGNLAGASRLATTPGVLKPSAAGSQIKQLGRGSEGMATLVAHPEHGVAVRKLYDPRGMSSPAMIARKEEAGRALGANPNFSRFLGSSPTPHGGGTMHFNEFIPQSNRAAAPSAINQATNQAKQSLNQVGFEGHDIRRGNMVQDARTGTYKSIDYIPAKPGEMSSSPDSAHAISVTPKGSNLFNDQGGYQTTNKGLVGGMLGGKPMGVRRYISSRGVSSPEPFREGGTTAFAGSPPVGPSASAVKRQAPTAVNKPTAPVTAISRPRQPTPPATAAIKPPKPVSGPAPAQL